MDRDEHLDAVEHAALQLKHIAKAEDFRRAAKLAEVYFGPLEKRPMQSMRKQQLAPE